MGTKIRRFTVPAAVFAVVASGFLATATPAFAAYSDCPNNYLCLWSGSNGTGTMVFKQNGTFMHNNPTVYFGTSGQAASANNRTLGRFCTYDLNLVATNVLNAQTLGNLANHNTSWVKVC